MRILTSKSRKRENHEIPPMAALPVVAFMICFIFVVGVYNQWPGKNARQSMTDNDNLKPLG